MLVVGGGALAPRVPWPPASTRAPPALRAACAAAAASRPAPRPDSHAPPSDSAGSFAAAAAFASKSEAVRSPACGPEGCQWLQLTHNSEEQAREVRPGWSTFAYDMEE